MTDSNPSAARTAGRGAGDPGDPAAPMYGPPSPLVPLETALRRPASTGLVLTLLVVNLLVTGWLMVRQEERIAEAASVASSSADTSGIAADLSQPQVCWLLGVVAAGQGKGSEVAKMALGGDAMGDCSTYAGRGARGQSLDGN